MRWILWTIVALVGVIGVIALVGYFLPVAHEASRSAEFNAPPDQVFALIADPNTDNGWWDGAEVKTEIVERVPPTKLVTKIVGETQFGGTWTFRSGPDAIRLATDDYGTRRDLQRDLQGSREVCDWLHGNDGQLSGSREEETKLKLETETQLPTGELPTFS